MIIDRFCCPNEFLQILTPMKFEVIEVDTKFDANQSGTIDKHEANKIFHF